MEEFKKVGTCYPGRDYSMYEVSENEAVRSIADSGPPRLLSRHLTRNNRITVYLRDKITRKPTTVLVHRVVCHVYHPETLSPERTQVHHIDGNPRNNLKFCTPKENMRYRSPYVVAVQKKGTPEYLELIHSITAAEEAYGTTLRFNNKKTIERTCIIDLLEENLNDIMARLFVVMVDLD
ncbi:unnamed protein product [Absidia cylindrospora]